MFSTPPFSPSATPVCKTPPKSAIESQEEPGYTPSLKEIWEDAQRCKEEQELFCSSCEDTDASEEDEPYAQLQKRAVVVRLPTGEVHVCGLNGIPCPYLEPTEGCMVCKYSGIEYGHDDAVDEFFDLNGGIGKKSGDPDQTCGEPVYGKYFKRPCALAASRAAYQAASGMDEESIPVYVPSEAKQRSASRPAKRGALCVGEKVVPALKRNRTNKKNVYNRDTCINLTAEAESVLGKLINFEKAASFNVKETDKKKAPRTCTPPDPRMCNESFVFQLSIKKYVRACITSGRAPSMDTVNNLAMMAREISKRAKENVKSSSSGDELRTAKFRTTYSGIIVALWSACCQTPYMANAKRGTDAYRPFVAGVIYASKRGVTLADGSVIVPRCPQLAEALPQLRGTGGNAQAKTLHSSSHRGLCTLARCIASVPPNKQQEVFGDLVRMAKHFSSLSFSKKDI